MCEGFLDISGCKTVSNPLGSCEWAFLHTTPSRREPPDRHEKSAEVGSFDWVTLRISRTRREKPVSKLIKRPKQIRFEILLHVVKSNSVRNRFWHYRKGSARAITDSQSARGRSSKVGWAPARGRSDHVAPFTRSPFPSCALVHPSSPSAFPGLCARHRDRTCTEQWRPLLRRTPPQPGRDPKKIFC